MPKLQYFGHLIQTDDLLEKSLMLGKIENRRRRGCQRMRWVDRVTDAMNRNSGKLGDAEGQGSLTCCVHGVAKTEHQRPGLGHRRLCRPVRTQLWPAIYGPMDGTRPSPTFCNLTLPFQLSCGIGDSVLRVLF